MLLGAMVRLAGLPTDGEPGSPALPLGAIRVELPPQTRVIGVKADAGEIVYYGFQVQGRRG